MPDTQVFSVCVDVWFVVWFRACMGVLGLFSVRL